MVSGHRLCPSILGPVQFNTFISDLYAEVECTVKMFADNTILGGPLDSLDKRHLAGF